VPHITRLEASTTIHTSLKYGTINTIGSPSRGNSTHDCDGATNPQTPTIQIDRLFLDGYRRKATIHAGSSRKVTVGDVLGGIEALSLIDPDADTGNDACKTRRAGGEEAREEETCPCCQPVTILDYLRHQYGAAGLKYSGETGVWHLKVGC
jgi:hypothetical protein